MPFERLLELAQLGLFAVAGGVAKQCHRMLKGNEAFSLIRFVLHICLAINLTYKIILKPILLTKSTNILRVSLLKFPCIRILANEV